MNENTNSVVDSSANVADAMSAGPVVESVPATASKKAAKRAAKEAHAIALAEAAKPSMIDRGLNVLELALGTAVVVGGGIVLLKYGFGLGSKAVAAPAVDVTPVATPDMHNL